MDISEVMGSLVTASNSRTDPARAIFEVGRHVIDHSDGSCACGAPFDDALEHLAEVTAAALGVPAEPSIDRRAENPERQRTLADRRTLANLTRTRRLLEELQKRQEGLAEALARTGLTSFADQADWLIAHRTPDEQLAADRTWEARIREAVHLIEVGRFTPTRFIQPEEAAA